MTFFGRNISYFQNLFLSRFHHELILFSLLYTFLNTLMNFLGYDIVHSGSVSGEPAVSTFRVQESLFHPEDRDRMFLKNVSSVLPDYTLSQLRRQET
jgi:hypothetical protein